MALPYLPSDTRMKIYKSRSRLEHMTDYEVRKHTGLPLENARELFEILTPFVQTVTSKGHAVPAESRILAALSFFRSGSFQFVEGTVGGMSQPTISRTLEKLTKGIKEHLAAAYIYFPEEVAVLNKIKDDFFSLANFPNVGGVIDGTHINIKAPSVNENAYVNRKGKHSINVQIVSGPNNSIFDAVIKWPGSTHDSYIWRNCSLKQRLERGAFGETWLLGDSGYSVQHCLLTPYPNPVGRAQSRFNSSQRKTRNVVERTLGVWKSRFRSMDQTGGILSYSPERCCDLILASIFLHNYFVFNKIELSAEDEAHAASYIVEDGMTSPRDLVEDGNGILTRDNVVLNYFDVNI